jgi:hypothetical protein
MLIQIYSGHNHHPRVVGSIEENNKLRTNYKIQSKFKENKLKFSKHILNSLLHETSSSKVVGLIKGNIVYSQPISQFKNQIQKIK